MQIDDKDMVKLGKIVADAVVNALKKQKLVGRSEKPQIERTAYQKTETLLYNYRGFKKLVEQRMQEIETIRQCGVPQRSKSIVQFSSRTNTVQGTVLPEESVEQAVYRVMCSIEDTVQAIEMVDNGMVTLQGDPYYEVLEMRYFDGLTQEDIGIKFGVSQVTISNNLKRLVRELSLQLFPDQTVKELIK